MTDWPDGWRVQIDTANDCSCPNDHPELDELVADAVDIHFEALGRSQWWMSITDRATGRRFDVNVGSVTGRAKGYTMIDEDEL